MIKKIILKISFIISLLVILISCLNADKKNLSSVKKDHVLKSSNIDSIKLKNSIEKKVIDSLEWLKNNNETIPENIKNKFFVTKINYLNKFDFFIDELQSINKDVVVVKYHINGLNCLYNYFSILDLNNGIVLDSMKSLDECDSDSSSDTIKVLEYNLYKLNLKITTKKFVDGNHIKSTDKVFEITDNKFVSGPQYSMIKTSKN